MYNWVYEREKQDKYAISQRRHCTIQLPVQRPSLSERIQVRYCYMEALLSVTHTAQRRSKHSCILGFKTDKNASNFIYMYINVKIIIKMT